MRTQQQIEEMVPHWDAELGLRSWQLEPPDADR